MDQDIKMFLLKKVLHCLEDIVINRINRFFKDKLNDSDNEGINSTPSDMHLLIDELNILLNYMDSPSNDYKILHKFKTDFSDVLEGIQLQKFQIYYILLDSREAIKDIEETISIILNFNTESENIWLKIKDLNSRLTKSFKENLFLPNNDRRNKLYIKEIVSNNQPDEITISFFHSFAKYYKNLLDQYFASS